MTTLYHYTCKDHGAPGILGSGKIEPHRQPPEGQAALVWLTDLEAPNRTALGLTFQMLQCDRMERRFTIPEPVEAHHWNDVKREHFPRWWIERLEGAPGAMPMHWFVSTQPQYFSREEMPRGIVH